MQLSINGLPWVFVLKTGSDKDFKDWHIHIIKFLGSESQGKKFSSLIIRGEPEEIERAIANELSVVKFVARVSSSQKTELDMQMILPSRSMCVLLGEKEGAIFVRL